jgi:hypothetical protein
MATSANRRERRFTLGPPFLTLVHQVTLLRQFLDDETRLVRLSSHLAGRQLCQIVDITIPIRKTISREAQALRQRRVAELRAARAEKQACLERSPGMYLVTCEAIAKPALDAIRSRPRGCISVCKSWFDLIVSRPPRRPRDATIARRESRTVPALMLPQPEENDLQNNPADRWRNGKSPI